jgi:glutathione S-transferase
MHLRLYHRAECHLCELALALLTGLDLQDDVELVDIDDDPELGVEFGLRIPVLECDRRQLDWPFDAAAIARL